MLLSMSLRVEMVSISKLNMIEYPERELKGTADAVSERRLERALRKGRSHRRWAERSEDPCSKRSGGQSVAKADDGTETRTIIYLYVCRQRAYHISIEAE